MSIRTEKKEREREGEKRERYIKKESMLKQFSER